MNLKEYVGKNQETWELSVSPREVISFRYETLGYGVEQ